MPPMIFVNLPVRDLERSRRFYASLGYTINEQFSDHEGACVVVSETIYVMLLTHPKFTQFTALPVTDETASTSHLFALSHADRGAVDRVMALALANGGSEPRPPVDMGPMYNRAFADPDGHVWEPFWMDPVAIGG